MGYKYSKGSQIIGDLKAADDTQRDTKIDFEEDYIGLETSGSVRMVISGSDGKVGIGVASPGYKLDINGDIRIRGNDIRDNSGNKAISFDGSANTVVSGTLKIENDMYVDVIRRQSDSSTTTKIRLMDEEVRVYAGNANDQVLKVESGNVEISGSIAITKAISTPAQPAVDQGYIYTKSDGKLYWRSNLLSETELTSTGDGGGGDDEGGGDGPTTAAVKVAYLSATSPAFSGGDTNEFFISWYNGSTGNQPDLRSNNQYFLYTNGGTLKKVTAYGSSATSFDGSSPFTNALKVNVYVWDQNDTSDIAAGNFGTGYVAVASGSSDPTDIKALESGTYYHRAFYSADIDYDIPTGSATAIAVSVQGVDAGNNSGKGFGKLNIAIHFQNI